MAEGPIVRSEDHRTNPVKKMLSFKLRFCFFTNSMAQTLSWEAKIPEVVRIFLAFLWNPKNHQNIYKILPLLLTLNHTNSENNIKNFCNEIVYYTIMASVTFNEIVYYTIMASVTCNSFLQMW
jgi:hypothetical protein